MSWCGFSVTHVEYPLLFVNFILWWRHRIHLHFACSGTSKLNKRVRPPHLPCFLSHYDWPSKSTGTQYSIHRVSRIGCILFDYGNLRDRETERKLSNCHLQLQKYRFETLSDKPPGMLKRVAISECRWLHHTFFCWREQNARRNSAVQSRPFTVIARKWWR